MPATSASTLDVLAAAGMLIDDRPSHVERYFATKTASLPEPMRPSSRPGSKSCSTAAATRPGQRSRDPQTARIHIIGHRPDPAGLGRRRAPIPGRDHPRTGPRRAARTAGPRRNWAEYGLRSLFRVLKARKLIFADPTRGMPATPVNATVPLPLDTEAIREALDSPDPAIALAVALVAFHALTADSSPSSSSPTSSTAASSSKAGTSPSPAPSASGSPPGSITGPAPGRPPSTRTCSSTRTAAPRLTPVGKQFPWKSTNLRPQALREDRILQEIHATGGDVRRICDLFGLTVGAAMRYAPLTHPDLERPSTRSAST